MGPLSIIQRYVFGGMAALMLVLSLWAVRIDGLRAKHKDAVDQMVDVLSKAGIAHVNEGNLAQAAQILVGQREKAKGDRDVARSMVEIQTTSIAQLEAEKNSAAREAEANRKLAEAAVEQRDMWIARAKAASTRTERLTADQEVQECQKVLDSLYSSGF